MLRRDSAEAEVTGADGSGKLFGASTYFLPSPMHLPTDRVRSVKYIVVTGGVCSSLGKGVTTSSLGVLLKSHGLRVSAIKIDPYINIDAGLMSPFEHGEVFVLGDGGEVDLDLGNYERWLNITLGREHNITTGKVYLDLIEKERAHAFLGKTVQVVPHFTNNVVERIQRVAQIPTGSSMIAPDVCLIELGGTIGDLESNPFVEALRTLKFILPPEDFCLFHCTYLFAMAGQQKTKPTQHTCRTLLSLGLTPDFLVCRSETPLLPASRSKLSQQVGLQENQILSAHNVSILYEVPLLLESQNVSNMIFQRLKLTPRVTPSGESVMTLDFLERCCRILRAPAERLRIAFVGKYIRGGSDAYFSVLQAFEHCCVALQVAVDFLWVEADELEGSQKERAAAALAKCDGIYVSGAFGHRGLGGMVEACRVARVAKVPCLGVCFGLQAAMVEIARNILGWGDATSEEFDLEHQSAHHVVECCTSNRQIQLGSHAVHIVDPNSKASVIYQGAAIVHERQRHRYKFNLRYMKDLQCAGVRFVAADDPTFNSISSTAEIVELPSHPYFMAVQFHPEFQSHVTAPSPPFLGFVAAASKKFPEALQLKKRSSVSAAIVPSDNTNLIQLVET